NGNAIHAASGLPVVWDFRSLDVMLGGQGAPLVPAGDKLLFSAYDICLNLGGIANLSMDTGGARKAFDICFANMGLNYLAAKAGKVFDVNGNLSASGELNKGMLRSLTKIYSTLRRSRPSLGREFFERKIRPLLDDDTISIADRLRTFTESIAAEIAAALPPGGKKKNMLCTGGGAFNAFLMSRILEHCEPYSELILPDEEIVKFKEALVFAFLGVLRITGRHNCLKSVTGASRDNTGGVVVGW
ncbi:MAG TPA: anhydro-N-acetylmuramic acid kinase, partial [Ohtaekwangia sp.]|nr:anhydro-N-acetylmuramic acid kinase [Ohtaekwangia sp.]